MCIRGVKSALGWTPGTHRTAVKKTHLSSVRPASLASTPHAFMRSSVRLMDFAGESLRFIDTSLAPAIARLAAKPTPLEEFQCLSEAPGRASLKNIAVRLTQI